MVVNFQSHVASWDLAGYDSVGHQTREKGSTSKLEHQSDIKGRNSLFPLVRASAVLTSFRCNLLALIRIRMPTYDDIQYWIRYSSKVQHSSIGFKITEIKFQATVNKIIDLGLI